MDTTHSPAGASHTHTYAWARDALIRDGLQIATFDRAVPADLRTETVMRLNAGTKSAADQQALKAMRAGLQRLMTADAIWRDASDKWLNAQSDFHGMDPRFKVAQERYDAACKELNDTRNAARALLAPSKLP